MMLCKYTLKTARGHVMSPPLHLSEIRGNVFHGKQKDAMNERTNEGVCVCC